MQTGRQQATPTRACCLDNAKGGFLRMRAVWFESKEVASSSWRKKKGARLMKGGGGMAPRSVYALNAPLISKKLEVTENEGGLVMHCQRIVFQVEHMAIAFWRSEC